MAANFQKIIDRISEAFSFFDFSFLISGSATFAICCYTLNRLGMDVSSDSSFLNVCVSIVGIYIAGLISFALGKKIRVWMVDNDGKHFEEIFNETVKFINDSKAGNDKQNLKLQYAQMWACLRDNQEAKESMTFLNRLWVMQAVFEGLMFSSVIAIVSGVILGIVITWNMCDVWYMIIGGLIAAIACYWEGKRYAETQIKEVIITYYQLKNKILWYGRQ